MKKQLLIIPLVLGACNSLFAQSNAKPKMNPAKHPYNVVFDITSKDTIDHKNVIRWINGIYEEHPDAKLEVVFYGKSLDMINKEKTIVGDAISKLQSNKNLAFKVCQVAMKNNNVTADQLVAGVQTVPDGIYEIISKQQDGWGYIKVSH